MIIKITEQEVTSGPCPIECKFLKKFGNPLGYNINGYDIDNIPPYSMLLCDYIKYGIWTAKGLIEIEEENAPRKAFITEGQKYLNLEDVTQLKIKFVEIPKSWVNIDSLTVIFMLFQIKLREYFKNEKVVIWFEYEIYDLCPMKTSAFDEEFNRFAPYLATRFMDILQPLTK